MSFSYGVMGEAQMETEHHSAAYLLPGPTTGTERDYKWELKGWSKDN